MEMQSNFGAVIQTDAEATKLFSCPYLVLSLLYLDEPNSIQFIHLRERTMR